MSDSCTTHPCSKNRRSSTPGKSAGSGQWYLLYPLWGLRRPWTNASKIVLRSLAPTNIFLCFGCPHLSRFKVEGRVHNRENPTSIESHGCIPNGCKETFCFLRKGLEMPLVSATLYLPLFNALKEEDYNEYRCKRSRP